MPLHSPHSPRSPHSQRRLRTVSSLPNINVAAAMEASVPASRGGSDAGGSLNRRGSLNSLSGSVGATRVSSTLVCRACRLAKPRGFFSSKNYCVGAA